MEGNIIILYLIAYPVYLVWQFWALRFDKQLRLRNANTRHEYIKELGEIFFNYKTLFWVYLIGTTL